MKEPKEVKKICKNCGTELKKYKPGDTNAISNKRFAKRKYCNMKCYGIDKRNPYKKQQKKEYQAQYYIKTNL